ncbi:N-methyltryptophan oxidase [Haloferax gibbonsii ATCC 33959]|uniref:N-methyltryptophan oxidase n=1 Tax=Haloferax gibbonsii (strain ATCC 33959 / DSM 4427 / JCM 8863 / NBRC 102184 / NCIMB 2188 / Ma 2.38) TaxID=1227459 RepID=M0HT25_HALGM|nr:N-methyl-L-tryptophan oxidase [Haloferax gibbonsii]ELZ86908.1 N-methyltryptophan oxidase [Haloferax gibbonsii ATCC 33959]
MRSSSTQYDVIVMGVGGIGSAAVYHLARRGLDVLGLDQYNIPNSIGSSHGDSRLIRLTNHEDPEYVPHVRRSISLWESLEEEYGEQLLHRTGTVDAGPADSETVRGSLKACTDYDLPYEHLSAGELSEKFPGFELPQEFEAVYQPDGGFINPTKCVQAHVELAQEHGATTHAHETVVDWESTANSVTVETDRTTYEANHVVVTAGAWTQLLVEELEETLTPWRVIVGGFQPENRSQFTADSFPVFSIEDEQQSYYGGPAAGTSGFKFGLVDNLEDVADPNDFDPRPTEKERERLRTVLHENAQRYFPEGAKSIKRLKTCMVTHTPDQDFIVDYLPSDPNVVVGAGFSGKGFKFSCLMGELLADLVTESDPAVDIDLFDIDRFQRLC